MLEDHTPASCYQSSPRSTPRRVPELEYADDVGAPRVATRQCKTGAARAPSSQVRFSRMSGWGCARLIRAILKCSTVRSGWGFSTPGERTFQMSCLARRAETWAGPGPACVEMTARGKPGNPTAGFPPFPPPLEIATAIPHIPTGPTIVPIINPEHGTRGNKKCYLCPRIKVLPMSPGATINGQPCIHRLPRRSARIGFRRHAA